MKITTLKASPHLYQATLSLIERCFEYEKPHTFEVGFFPLVNESNWENNFITIDETENVLAHIGVCERRTLGVTIAMLGGIAVDSAHRGEGLFKELMQEVMAEKRSDAAFFLLWSDQEKLYKKFGFHLCGTQIEVPESSVEKTFIKTKFHQLSEAEKKQVESLYASSFSKIYTTTDRTAKDWSDIARITSADLFIQRTQDEITAYFFMNKGQDLSDVIYEYGVKGELKDYIPKMSAYGRVWLGSPFAESHEMQFQFFLAPGDTRLFTEFVRKFTADKMLIHDINVMKQEVYFHFNDELLSLETEDFLRGILGPGVFEEIEPEIRPLFISGLVSV